MTGVIRCAYLTKRYRGVTALDGLDRTVEPGQVFGFLGPNGAGKTTTLRILLGLVMPSAGQAWLNGRRIPDSAR
jgi:ABC-2 type transport system ATP-binding protein